MEHVCEACGAANPAGARFCGGCGRSWIECPRCGSTEDRSSRFCAVCGAALEGQSAAAVTTDLAALPPPEAIARRRWVLPRVLAGLAVAVLVSAGIAAALLRPWQDDTPPGSPPLAKPAVANSEPPAVAEPELETESSPEAVVPPPAVTGPAPVRRRLTLIPLARLPAAPYRCVSPYARDHTGRMALVLRYASGEELSLVSTGSGDEAPFILCGGSRTHGLPGLASATLRFEQRVDVVRLVRIGGIVGGDFDVGPGHHVEIDVLYGGEVSCSFSTDSVGHARRFSCAAFPQRSTLSELRVRLRVSGDQEYGVFAGIARLWAVIAVEGA